MLAEEADAAYDRVGLTSYTESWDRALLALPGNDYAGDERVRLLLNARVTEIDRAAKSVVTADGQRHSYDALVLATGSYAFVPPVPGHDLPGCHVYRTLDDLDGIRAAALRAAEAGRTGAGVVIGGGLLGLEAANALQPVRVADARRRDGAATDGPADRRGRRRAAVADDRRPRHRGACRDRAPPRLSPLTTSAVRVR